MRNPTDPSTPAQRATEDPTRPSDEEHELDRLVEASYAATARADDVTARMSLGLASDAEIRAALGVDPMNPYSNTSGLVTQCMLMGRWDSSGDPMENDGLTPLRVIAIVRRARFLPDGRKMPSGLAHALLVLATYYPNIWPGQHRLAEDMCIDRSNVNRRLRKLEDAGLIERFQRGEASTLYRLSLSLIRKCSGCGASATGRVIGNGTDEEGADGTEDYLGGR
jgi:hypothetical protein